MKLVLERTNIITLSARSWFSNFLAANHLCTYAHRTELSEFVLHK